MYFVVYSMKMVQYSEHTFPPKLHTFFAQPMLTPLRVIEDLSNGGLEFLKFSFGTFNQIQCVLIM